MRGRQTHQGMILRIEALFMTLILWGMSAVVGAASQPMLGENLEYTLKFRGLITGYVELDIAKMTLEVEQDMGEVFDSPAYITNLQVTTEPYSKAEMLYPVRLKYRSWLDAHKLHPLIAVKTLKARVEREEFFLFDRKSGQAFHYQTGEDEVVEPEIPPLQLRPVTTLTQTEWSALTQTQAIEMKGEDALDYMGLIHRLRGMPLESGNPIEFSTYNGKEIEWFRIDVSRERLLRAGWDRETFKLKLREIDPENGDLGEAVHIWMSDDDQRLLLRFYAERTFGAMEGILETGRPVDQQQSEGLSDATKSSMETYLDF
ncbi:MAG: DUF3108 domain-containing protein [Candidatus Thiodiazotropha sp. 6PLUC2]